MYGETGRLPIYISTAISYIKYWHRVINIDIKQNVLLREAYIENERIKSAWLISIEKLLNMINVSPEKASKLKCPNLGQMLLTKFKAIFECGWKEELYNDTRKKQGGNKLRLYRKYKSNFSLEPYLLSCNQKQRRNLARLRLSSHKLEVETQRYSTTYIPPEERKCKQCDLSVCEDEIHFLIQCPKYEIERKSFFEWFKNNYIDLNIFNDEQKFLYLMSHPNREFNQTFAQFTSKCFEIRYMSNNA